MLAQTDSHLKRMADHVKDWFLHQIWTGCHTRNRLVAFTRETGYCKCDICNILAMVTQEAAEQNYTRI